MTEKNAPDPHEPDKSSAQQRQAEPAPGRTRSRRSARRRERAQRALTFLALTVLLAVALLLTAWPWPRHFLSGLSAGAEAPRDAWKLSWGAHRLLEGRILPAHDAPAFYPHAGALDFDDPLYIPSLVAAIPYAATRDAVITYNVTLLVFWVLSGLMMYLFLRELGIGRLACVFGAAAFVLLPSRTALFADIGAQVCFGVPLCLMALTRWIRTQQRGWAFFLSLALWMQTMSTLAYGFALIVALPLVALVALLRRRPSPVDDRLMYDGIAIMVIVPLLLFSIFLGPAIGVRTSAALTDAYEERGPGAAQPLTYLSPDEGSVVDAWALPASKPNASLFPGFAVLALAGVYGFFQRQMLRRIAGQKRAARIAVTVLALARLALWFFVGIVCLVRAAAPTATLWKALGQAVGPALIGILALTFVLALAARRHPRALGTALMHGLGLAAVACFIVSLGPDITTGSPPISLSRGPLIHPETAHRFLGTIAPLSRLGIVPVVFLIAAAAWILDELIHHRWFRWVAIPALALVGVESLILPNRFEPADLGTAGPVMAHLARHSPTAERLDKAVELRSVFVIPAGEPAMDARTLLALTPRFNLMVNGSATVTPAAYHTLVEAFRRGNIATGSAHLTALWPKPYLLIDRKTLAEHGEGSALDEKALSNAWTLVLEDDRYALYEPLAITPTPLVIHKNLRRDLAGRYRRLRIRARMKFSDESLEPYLVVHWNGKGDQSYALTSEFQSLEFDGMAHWVGTPEGDIVTIALVFKVEGNETFTPAEEALVGYRIDDVWEISEIAFCEPPRR